MNYEKLPKTISAEELLSTPLPPVKWIIPDLPREASKMFQCIKYEDKREAFGLKIHSFSTLDRIKKYDGSDNEGNAEKPYSIEVGEIERTINLYAIASTKFHVVV